MHTVKAATYSRIVADPTIMNLLGGQGPLPGRLVTSAPFSREHATITFDGQTSVVRGSKEDQTLTLHIWAYSHDLTEEVSENLDRLFRPTPGRQWFFLPTSEGRAFVRKDFARDVPDDRSEFYHLVYRLRIRFGWSAAA